MSPSNETAAFDWNSSSMVPDEHCWATLRCQLETTRFVVQKIIVPLVVTFGVLGNAVTVAVLTRPWMKSSTNSYLTVLAVYDLLYLVFAFTMSLNHYMSIKDSIVYQRYRVQVGRPLTDTVSNTGVWLTLTFTVERYIAVCYPMKGKVWCTTQRARYIAIVVSLLAAAITLPEFFDSRVILSAGPPNVTSSGTPRRVMTSMGKSQAYTVWYKYANQTLFTFLPLTLLVVFNYLLIAAVRTAARRRHLMSNGDQQLTGNSSRLERHLQGQQRITVMLISVVIVFLVCQLPQALQHLYVVYIGTHVTLKRRYVLTITGNVFNLLVAINCSVNFILYSSFSSKFRATFRRLVRPSVDTSAAATSAAALRASPFVMTTIHADVRTAGRASSQWILYGQPVHHQQQQTRRMTCQIEYTEL